MLAMDNAMVRIKRNSGYVDSLREYEIFVDGDKIGEIQDGGVFEFDISQGEHEIYLKIDWGRSNVVRFSHEGEFIEFGCGNRLKGWRVLFWPFHLVFLRKKYLWLKITEQNG